MNNPHRYEWRQTNRTVTGERRGFGFSETLPTSVFAMASATPAPAMPEDTSEFDSQPNPALEAELCYND